MPPRFIEMAQNDVPTLFNEFPKATHRDTFVSDGMGHSYNGPYAFLNDSMASHENCKNVFGTVNANASSDNAFSQLHASDVFSSAAVQNFAATNSARASHAAAMSDYTDKQRELYKLLSPYGVPSETQQHVSSQMHIADLHPLTAQILAMCQFDSSAPLDKKL